MIRIVKRKLAVEKELLSKIEWENDLVKYTKIILPLKQVISILSCFFI